jgi:hypothetical protein
LFQVHPGVLAGGVQVAVSEKIGHCFEPDAAFMQSARKRMTQQMRSTGLNLASTVSTADGASKPQNCYGAAHRQVMAEENVLSGRFRTAIP